MLQTVLDFKTGILNCKFPHRYLGGEQSVNRNLRDEMQIHGLDTKTSRPSKQFVQFPSLFTPQILTILEYTLHITIQVLEMVVKNFLIRFLPLMAE